MPSPPSGRTLSVLLLTASVLAGAVPASGETGVVSPLPENVFAPVGSVGSAADQAAFVAPTGSGTVRIDRNGFGFVAGEVEVASFRFSGGGAAAVQGTEVQRGVLNLLLGDDPASWRTGVPLYGRVVCRDAFPGVDVEFRFRDGALEYDLILSATADANSIMFDCEAATRLAVEEDDLVIETDSGTLIQKRPQTYAVDDQGRRRPLDHAFRVVGPDSFGFDVGAARPDERVVIDPVVQWATYLGAQWGSQMVDLALAANDDVIVCGWVNGDLPFGSGGTANAYLHAVLVRLDSGGGLVSVTYLGGTGHSAATGIAIDGQGRIHLAGFTEAPDWPITSGALYTTVKGRDAFYTILDPTGTQILFSTYLGGAAVDGALHLGLDSQGIACIAGETRSMNFPTTPNAFDTIKTETLTTDVFVSRIQVDTAGVATLLYSTYLGGSEIDEVEDLAVFPSGNVCVCGVTKSNGFPVSPGAIDTTRQLEEGFVTTLDPQKSGAASLVFSTFLGGSGIDRALGLRAAPGGDVWVVGTTGSTQFPTTPGPFTGPYDLKKHGPSVGFVAHLDAKAATLQYGGLLGGKGMDFLTGIDFDASGRVVLVGTTDHSPWPVTPDAFQSAVVGGFDVTFTILDPGLTSVQYATYAGGDLHDSMVMPVLDTNRDVALLCGACAYGDSNIHFPTTPGALQNEPLPNPYPPGIPKTFSQGAMMSIDIGCRGGYVAYGASCTGSGGLRPWLFAKGCSDAGQLLTLEIADAPAGAAGLLTVGSGQQSAALAPDCLAQNLPWLVTPVIFTSSTGAWIQTAGVPAIAGGIDLYLQAFLQDAVPAGAIGTNGLTVRIR